MLFVSAFHSYPNSVEGRFGIPFSCCVTKKRVAHSVWQKSMLLIGSQRKPFKSKDRFSESARKLFGIPSSCCCALMRLRICMILIGLKRKPFKSHVIFPCSYKNTSNTLDMIYFGFKGSRKIKKKAKGWRMVPYPTLPETKIIF